MQVKELVSVVEKVSPDYHTTSLNQLEYRGDRVVDRANGQEYNFTDSSLNNFVNYLTIPAKFFERLNTDLREQTVNYMLQRYADEPVLLSNYGHELGNLYSANTSVIPNRAIAEVATKIFGGEDSISDLRLDEGIRLSIPTMETQVAVKPGDVTNGGLRFHYSIGKTPYVSAYMERLVCSNGMITERETDQLQIRGRTLTEITAEMEHLARKILVEDVPSYLNNWDALSRIESSNPEQLIHRLVREHGIGSRLESAIIERASALEDNSYYSVINLITSLQHESGLDYNAVTRLRTLGGAAVRDMGGHRCNNCQHNLA